MSAYEVLMARHCPEPESYARATSPEALAAYEVYAKAAHAYWAAQEKLDKFGAEQRARHGDEWPAWNENRFNLMRAELDHLWKVRMNRMDEWRAISGGPQL